MSSLVHLILWVTMAMIGASIVLYVKTNSIDSTDSTDSTEKKMDPTDEMKEEEKKKDPIDQTNEKGEKDEKNEKNQKDENHKDEKNQKDAKDANQKDENQKDEEKNQKTNNPPQPSSPVENVVMYIFAATGVVMAIISWVVEQKGDVSFVGLSLLLSLMVCCLGLGGIAGVIADVYVPREHLLGLAKAVCAVTGLVVIGILSMIRGGM